MHLSPRAKHWGPGDPELGGELDPHRQVQSQSKREMAFPSPLPERTPGAPGPSARPASSGYEKTPGAPFLLAPWSLSGKAVIVRCVLQHIQALYSGRKSRRNSDHNAPLHLITGTVRTYVAAMKTLVRFYTISSRREPGVQMATGGTGPGIEGQYCHWKPWGAKNGGALWLLCPSPPLPWKLSDLGTGPFTRAGAGA